MKSRASIRRKRTDSPKHDFKLGRMPIRERSPDHRQTDPAKKVSEAARERFVWERRLMGIPLSRIAEQLGVDLKTVGRIWNRAHEEYLEDHKAFVAQRVAEQTAAYDHFRSRWYLDAHGGSFVDDMGNKVDVKKDPEAARLYLRAMRDFNALIGHGATVRIDTANITNTSNTLQVDAVSAAALVRSHFASKVTPPLMNPALNPRAAEVIEAARTAAMPAEEPDARRRSSA